MLFTQLQCCAKCAALLFILDYILVACLWSFFLSIESFLQCARTRSRRCSKTQLIHGPNLLEWWKGHTQKSAIREDLGRMIVLKVSLTMLSDLSDSKIPFKTWIWSTITVQNTTHDSTPLFDIYKDSTLSPSDWSRYGSENRTQRKKLIYWIMIEFSKLYKHLPVLFSASFFFHQLIQLQTTTHVLNLSASSTSRPHRHQIQKTNPAHKTICLIQLKDGTCGYAAGKANQ